MGTLNYTVTASGRNPNVQSAGVVASDNHGTTTSEGAVTGLTTQNGQVVKCVADEAMWISFGGTAAVGTGHILTANIPEWFEIDRDTAGAVSAIDVS